MFIQRAVAANDPLSRISSLVRGPVIVPNEVICLNIVFPGSPRRLAQRCCARFTLPGDTVLQNSLFQAVFCNSSIERLYDFGGAADGRESHEK
jgi:hypothetical protein